jgi:hypothetical protein
MKIKPKSDDYYKKYKYLIWRDDIGFLHLETFSFEELKRFSENIEDQLEKIINKKKEIDIDANTRS